MTYMKEMIAIIVGLLISGFATTFFYKKYINTGHKLWMVLTIVFAITAVALIVTALAIGKVFKKEKFQHGSTHKIVLENERKTGYMPCMSNDLSKHVPQEIPKFTETPYTNDNMYKQEIPHELYENFEQEQEEPNKPEESTNELPENETPVTTMTQPDIEDSVVYPRVIKALPNKRNRGQGDPIRGDLAIMPEPCGWFRPSATPNIDLRQGALNVIAGEENEQGKAITNLINSTSGSIYIAGKEIDEPQHKVESSEAMYAL